MSRQFKTSLTLLLLTLVVATGCHPTQPLYLRSDGDLSHYIEQATDLEYPDTQYTSLEDVEQARHPFTVGEFEDAEKWSLSLEECVSMALHNSKVIRRLDQTTTPGTPQQFISNPESFQTVYDPSIFETDPDAGVHAALAQFDTQLNAGLYGGQNPGADGLGGYTNVDVPQNNNALGNAIFAPTFEQTTATMQAELAKRTASGATFRARHTLAYDRNNRPTNAVSSTWDTRFQIEATLPLLRGRGAQVNRVGVSVARINTDIALADFEASVRNMTSDVEAAYWNLYCAYRFLEVQKEARDAALQAAQASRAKRGKILPRYDSARASELYFRYRGDVEQQLRTLYDAESNLRFLMGLAHTDGRLILPGDEPTTARVDFNYNEAHTEALVRTAELRRQKWRVKQRELQLIAARNNLLPQLDAFAQYTWLGIGDELISAQRNGIDFPGVGSTAYEELTDGDFQGFTTGFQFSMPLGFRAELAGVRNSQLNLAREKERLKDLELNVSHNLASSLRSLDQNYETLQSNFNRWRYTEDEVAPLLDIQRGPGTIGPSNAKVNVLDRLLDAVQRRTLARQAYYQSLCDYNKGIADVHLRKGSLLEYNNISLAEGPWPQKAYWDALAHARRRDASTYVDYGWTRPQVFSRGQVPQRTDELLQDGVIIGDPNELPYESAPQPIIEEGSYPPGAIIGEPEILYDGPATGAPAASSMIEQPLSQTQRQGPPADGSVQPAAYTAEVEAANNGSTDIVNQLLR